MELPTRNIPMPNLKNLITPDIQNQELSEPRFTKTRKNKIVDFHEYFQQLKVGLKIDGQEKNIVKEYKIFIYPFIVKPKLP